MAPLRRFPILLPLLLAVASSAAARAAEDEIPARFEPRTGSFDHERREVEIPMRDGVKLHTVILVPRGAKGRPILLTRTPYEADRLTAHASSIHLGPVLAGYDHPTDVVVEGRYIRVVQDVRGKYRSGGEYVMNRPLRGRWNPTDVDHATDTFDTVEWLVKNVPETNGKVGILGISYDGFLPLMALVDPHPALKVAVAMNPMVDGWMGDDWFHHGAFRQTMASYIHDQEADRKNEVHWWSTHADEFEEFLAAGSAGEVGRRHGLEQLGFWRKILAHPTYDAFWRDQAMDRVLAARPLKVPLMLVHGLFDQEDNHGAPAVYAALEPKDASNDRVFLVMGPWNHGQQIGDGSALGAIRWDADTSLRFRREVLAPFLAQHLEDAAPRAGVAPVVAFQTGTNRWEDLPSWPPPGAAPVRLHLGPGLRAGLGAAPEGGAEYDAFVSDPAKPVPYRRRPIEPYHTEAGREGWRRWLVDDQREASGRTDVLAYVSDVLEEPVRIAGRPLVNLVASTTGTDADWVVKLIDVFPDEVAHRPDLGGYQLMIAADVFRGRYRESFETPRPVPAGKPLPYRFSLPTANHVFLPGHRIMVQVQSSWFPLYDRNPQRFVPSIFDAKPSDYTRAEHRIWHAPGKESWLELPVVKR